MVVVSGSRVKNVATYPSSTPPVQQSPVTLTNNNNNNSSTCLSSSSSTTGDGSSTMVILAGGTTMAVAGSGGAVVAVARAELICRPNSYHFQERVLSLSEPAKVGRSVARARACHDNAIFDCKVLSRNHAMLWYDAGKFYLQDTNSSNGTFVNNNRLPSNESQPHEVNSGDIVQFGVDVVENCKKVTHGCIIATLKLYLPDGKEAKASPSIVERSRQCVPLDELYKLNQIIQEACQREFWLESKLSALQLIVDQARKAADESWQAYVGEERLLSRVATLENQLLQASKGSGEDQLKEELNKLQKEKSKYQIAAKESLNKLRGELLEAIISTNEQQRARATAEHEAIYAKDQLEQTQQELQQLAKKLIYEQEQTNECRIQLKDREKELLEKLEQETQQVFDLKKSLEELRLLGLNSNTDVSEKYNLICKDDFKTKEEMIAAENEAIEERVDDLNKSNGVVEPQENNKNLKEEIERPYYTTEGSELTESNNSSSNTDENVITENNTDSNLIEEIKLESEESSISSSDDEDTSQITINPSSTTLDSPPPPPDNSTHSQLEKHSLDETTVETQTTSPFTTADNSVNLNTVDSKTLKYHMASVHQHEYRRQIDELQLETSVGKVRESALVGELNRAKSDGAKTRRELDEVRGELAELRLQQREMCNETQRLRDRVRVLREEGTEAGKVKDESEVVKEESIDKKGESKEKKEESKEKMGENKEKMGESKEKIGESKEKIGKNKEKIGESKEKMGENKEKKDESKQVKEESKEKKEKKDEVKQVKEESKQVMEKSKGKKEESKVKKEESKDNKEDSKDNKEDSKDKKVGKSKEAKEKDGESEDGLENGQKDKREEKLRISELEDSADIMSTSGENNMMSASSCTTLSVADVANLESELIALKERYAQINDEKVTLNRKLATLHDQYNTLCNKSYNTMFYYIAPLVFMVIYLLVSSMFS